VTDDRLERLWLDALQGIVARAAHEVKDALNGVALNLEVIRSRSSSGRESGLGSFAESASAQLEALTARTEALLFLARAPKSGSDETDLAVTLKHLAALLVPAAKSEGGSLEVDGIDVSLSTAAPSVPVRLALAAPLLGLIKEGGRGRCSLQQANSGASGPGAVVRFSHESAVVRTVDPDIAKAIQHHGITAERSDNDLLVTFPAITNGAR
jgi:hypothetical protein